MSRHEARPRVVAEVVRSGFVESRHHGTVVGLAPSGASVVAVGPTREAMFPRSANKPMQAAAMVRAGLPLRGELLALAAASHSGEDFHVDAVRKVLAGAGLGEDALGCPPDLPLDVAARDAWLRRGGSPERIRMNCSGKHAAMLATCVVNGWPTGDYLDPAHPLQAHVRSVLEDLSGDPVTATAVDGCGAPLFAVSLEGVARAFRALVLAEPGSPERQVADDFRAFPELTSGTRRAERALMAGVPGLLVKSGAEGVMAFALADGRAGAVKIEDGNARATVPVVVAVLRALDVDAPILDEYAAGPVLGGGERVGDVRAVLPAG